MKSLIMSLDLVKSLGFGVMITLAALLLVLDTALILLGLWLAGVGIEATDPWAWVGALVIVLVLE